MIYEISTNDIPSALASGAILIIISADSSVGLVKSYIDMDCIESYDDDQLNSLLNEAKWRQPCKDCEV